MRKKGGSKVVFYDEKGRQVYPNQEPVMWMIDDAQEGVTGACIHFKKGKVLIDVLITEEDLRNLLKV